MAPLAKRIKNDLIYGLVVGLIALLRFLPRGSAAALMCGLAGAGFRLARKEREKTIRHLTWAYGSEKSPAQIEALAGAVWSHFGVMAVDAIRLPRILAAGINTLVEAQGVERLRSALGRGRGVIVLTGHFGNWELFGAWVAQNGFPVKVVGTSAYDPRLDRIIVGLRNAAGYTNIARGKGTREIIRTLRDNEVLGMLIDQDTRVDGVFVNFFGRAAHTAVGPVILAQKMGCALLPAFIHLKEDGRYLIEFDEEITLTTTGDAAQDQVVNTQKISDAYERAIRRHPEQWVWMHERWKKQPGEGV
ncbi:MAG: Phosphatidylinositol mannoside acyltransferase [bacterium ADurb.Bin431]|nr:MAG: Phosphatidylinositol mannoside acyltransferase [bacterium ADurb.Bin431]